MPRILIAFVIIIILLTIIAGGYFTYQKYFSTPAGWKTYENKDFGIEFKYPDSYTIHDNANMGHDLFIDIWSDSGNLSFSADINLEDGPYNPLINIQKNELSIKRFGGRDWFMTYNNIVPTEGISEAEKQEPVEWTNTTAYSTDYRLVYGFQCNNCDANLFGKIGQDRLNEFNTILSTVKIYKNNTVDTMAGCNLKRLTNITLNKEYLSGKYYVIPFASGEDGIFSSDGTVLSDKQPKYNWEIKDGNLMINGLAHSIENAQFYSFKGETFAQMEDMVIGPGWDKISEFINPGSWNCQQ